MKEYKEIYNDIEYHVIEVYDQEIKGSSLIEYTKSHQYTIIRKFENDKLIKEMVFKDGKIHNEYGRALMKIKIHHTSNTGNRSHILTWEQTLNSFYLNGEQYSEEEEFKNELRKIRLDETLQY